MNEAKLIQFEAMIKSRIAYLVTLQQQQQHDRENMKKEIHDLSKNSMESVSQTLDNHIIQQTKFIKDDIQSLRNSMESAFGFKDPLSSNFAAAKSYDESVHLLRKEMATLAKYCHDLNIINFDKKDPPRVYTQENVFSEENEKCDEKEISKGVIRSVKDEYADKILTLCYDILLRIKEIEAYYREKDSSKRFLSEIPGLEQKLYGEYLEKEDARWRKALKDNILIDYDIFHDFDDWQQQGTPDLEGGSLTFKDEVYLGDRCSPIIRKGMAEVDKSIISLSNALQSRVENGYLKSPFVLDLKKSPHLFINVRNSEASENTIDFVHEYIQSILLSQPSGRVNMCLVDFNDRCKFNRYAVLKNISQNVLMKGIVRSERDIENVLSDMESTMFDIGDNKLSVANVSNVFEFNRISVENPQNIHLMVLMDFPEKYSYECFGHIAKIVANGADCGIYTLIVNNTEAKVDFGSRKQMVDDAISQIRKHCIILNERHDGKFVFDSTSNQELPTTLIPSRVCTDMVFNKDIYPVLSKNAEAQIDTVISLAPFFELSRKFRATKSKDNNFSRLLEIPIGKNGGDVQCLRFFTDSGNAHALVIGGTGSGKSNLLHTIILSACYRYSPDELQIYLVDFKGGVEFKFYQANKVVKDQLPHIRLTGLTSEPEDGVAILTNIRRILRERENTFRRHDVEDIIAYNAQCPTGKQLPRMLIIIDEVQELMTNQRLAEQALDILGELFKKGRAFGISILWASQTVPKGVSGFKDKVLSQISNRICLKVNNTDDAADLDFDVRKIRALNRPEKGLGLISDGLNEIEFRVAYAENRENRREYVHEINNHWSVDHRTPLFIVGDDEIPNVAEGNTIFNQKAAASAKSNNHYNICLGQNYITGDPYHVSMASKGSNEHCWIAGKDVEVLRDAIGYALLSVLMEHKTNSDVPQNSPVKHYYYNGELMNDNRDLFCVLPQKFPSMIHEVDITNIADALVELYRIRKARAAAPAINHTPIYFFIHQFQKLSEVIANTSDKYSVEENKITKNEATEMGSNSSSFSSGSFSSGSFSSSFSSDFSNMGSTNSGGKVTVAQIFNDLFHYGADVGIHFVVTINNPVVIPEVKAEMAKFTHKIVLEGVPRDSVSLMIDVPYIRDVVPSKEGVAFHYYDSSMQKLKTYRYDPEDASQVKWLDSTAK